MINKKLFLFLMLSIFLISILSAQVSYCCERLDSGAWCQNAPETECDPDYRSVPTSCEATSYCKLGVCINNQEGTCLPNTPERVCTDANGVWDEKEKDEIPQCQLGCCLIGEQAAFVTLTRCKSLASQYGLEINYRTDIQSEMECIANARPKVKGACVYEEEYQRTCKFTTRKECQEMEIAGEEDSVEFHEGFLCSATELSTNCGFPGGTTCVEGRDEIYFLDTCGNLANVYDYEKRNTPSYWEKIIAPDCGDADGNKNSMTCGNCDYFLGSTCKEGNANYGDFICKNLNCEYEGETYQHGETWCAKTNGVSIIDLSSGGEITTDSSTENLPGSRYFRLVCYNNEVSVEPCADFRQEVCIQSEVRTFRTAACRVNMWQDCYSQDNEKDCDNTARRDCKWIKGVSILKEDEKAGGSCVPLYSPGFNFWEEETDATSMCSQATKVCSVEYAATVMKDGVDALVGKKGKPYDAKCMNDCREECNLLGILLPGECNRKCEKDCPSQCMDDDGTIKQSWKEDRNDLCMAIGDCGGSLNYFKEKGYYDNVDDFITRSGEKK